MGRKLALGHKKGAINPLHRFMDRSARKRRRALRARKDGGEQRLGGWRLCARDKWRKRNSPGGIVKERERESEREGD